ncbi:hypothetical protein [Methylomonas sp. HYX-M1]|uniref:hypothetical protein n=1 Tax=Methylomonas sp. HYX-M1 TaxID=3139307 RepID=UPI00345B69B3
MPNLVPVCPETITVDVNGALQCSQPWQAVEQPLPFDFAQIDPLTFAECMGAGFSISLPVLVFAWGGRLIYQQITGKKP